MGSSAYDLAVIGFLTALWLVLSLAALLAPPLAPKSAAFVARRGVAQHGASSLCDWGFAVGGSELLMRGRGFESRSCYLRRYHLGGLAQAVSHIWYCARHYDQYLEPPDAG